LYAKSNDPAQKHLLLNIMLRRGLFILLAIVHLIDAIPTIILDHPMLKCFEVEAPIDTILRVTYNAPGTSVLRRGWITHSNKKAATDHRNRN
jgi:hypothetical protein